MLLSFLSTMIKMAPTKSIKYLLFIYVAGSLFYATFHVLQLSQSNPPVPRHRSGGRIAPRSANDESIFQQQQQQQQHIMIPTKIQQYHQYLDHKSISSQQTQQASLST